jgi:hypothetical protein
MPNLRIRKLNENRTSRPQYQVNNRTIMKFNHASFFHELSTDGVVLDARVLEEIAKDWGLAQL